MPEGKNCLYYGDNLEVLKLHVKDESVDLVYLDPPFKSNQNYNVLFAERNGTRSSAQIKAFKDTWRWDQEAAVAYREVVEAAIGVLITMLAPTKAMRAEATSADSYYSPGWDKHYPGVQILTVEDLLAGRRINYSPSKQVNVTFKKSPKRERENEPGSSDLFDR